MKGSFPHWERSYVDISTNYANIASVDLDFEAEDFLSGDINVHHLLTLIHEITHHWSLTSYVGTALSAHHLRSHVLGAKALSGIDLSFKEQEDIERSVIIGNICHGFLAPLFEGLALYAEWRATPFDDVIYSRPFAIVRRLVGGAHSLTSEEKDELKEIFDEFKNAGTQMFQELMGRHAIGKNKEISLIAPATEFVIGLQSLRAKPEYLYRKSSLFEKRINPVEDPYQIGYAFICGLELSCSGSVNSDRFLAFLKDYFLNDVELARVISQDWDGPELYSRLRDRLQSRVAKFYTEPDNVLVMFNKWDEDQGFIREIGGNVNEKFGTSEHIHHSCGVSKQIFSEQRAAFNGEVTKIVDVKANFSGLSPVDLKEFLFIGRLAMPLRVREAKISNIEGGCIHCETAGGARFTFPTETMCHHVEVGEEVIILLMVSVSSGDTGLCFFSKSSNEVFLTNADDSAHEFWNEALKNYPKIMELRQAGSEALDRLRVVPDRGDSIGERLDSGVMELLRSEPFRIDLEQIYRMPIVLAFSDTKERFIDSSWREREFEKWKGNGVSSILKNPRDLIDFTRCSMVTMRIKIDFSDFYDVEISEDDVFDALISSVYGLSKREYLEIVERLDEVSLAKGVKLFSENVQGFRFPYL